jgi:hypothetical protein
MPYAYTLLLYKRNQNTDENRFIFIKTAKMTYCFYSQPLRGTFSAIFSMELYYILVDVAVLYKEGPTFYKLKITYNSHQYMLDCCVSHRISILHCIAGELAITTECKKY